MLLYRIAPDVSAKPLYEDEAVAGLIAMRPLVEVLETVMADRGGAPLHFVLAHAVFRVDASVDALRWLSVVAALAAVPLCFDLARRLGGTGAGIVAAVVVASSTALGVYGSFGRMYALFVLVAALAADLFVRALRLRTPRAVTAAAAAAWLLPAVHPYGAIPAFVELAVAAAIWRGRSIRAALPVTAIVLAAVPFLVADLRLAERAQVGSGGRAIASPADAWDELSAALSAFAGGDGLPFAFFAALALVGFGFLLRREPAFATVAATVALPPVLFLLLRAGSEPDLSPRHLFYALPLWAAAIGVGAASLARRLPTAVGTLVVAAVLLVAVASPASALRDPRELGLLPSESRVAVRAGADELLVPYAVPFITDLDAVRDALAIPQGPGEEIVGALDHVGEPIRAVHVAIPGQSRWTVVTRPGPFGKAEALLAAAEVYRASTRPEELDWWFALVTRGLCDAVRELGPRCPS